MTMQLRKSLFVAGAVLSLVARPVSAQTPPSCFDPLGNPVPAFPDPTIPDIAFATVRAPIGPVILYQPAVVTAPNALRYFIYFHECAHHALGDVLRQAQGFPPRPTQETDADCSSVVFLATNYGMTQTDFTLISNAFLPNPPRPPFYPAGPIRVQLMLSCLNQRGITLPP